VWLLALTHLKAELQRKMFRSAGTFRLFYLSCSSGLSIMLLPAYVSCLVTSEKIVTPCRKP
jgi:hypothetical protein